MQIYFHSRLWSYLPRVPILVEGTVYIWDGMRVERMEFPFNPFPCIFCDPLCCILIVVVALDICLTSAFAFCLVFSLYQTSVCLTKDFM